MDQIVLAEDNSPDFPQRSQNAPHENARSTEAAALGQRRPSFDLEAAITAELKQSYTFSRKSNFLMASNFTFFNPAIESVLLLKTDRVAISMQALTKAPSSEGSL